MNGTKPSVFIVLMKSLDNRNRFFIETVVLTEVIALHCNTSLFWEGQKYAKCCLQIQGFTVAKQVA